MLRKPILPRTFMITDGPEAADLHQDRVAVSFVGKVQQSTVFFVHQGVRFAYLRSTGASNGFLQFLWSRWRRFPEKAPRLQNLVNILAGASGTFLCPRLITRLFSQKLKTVQDKGRWVGNDMFGAWTLELSETTEKSMPCCSIWLRIMHHASIMM